MSEATPEEKRAHVLGLLLATARLVAKVATVMGDDLSQADDGDGIATEFGKAMLLDVVRLRGFIADIEAEKYRGRVQGIENARPGVLMTETEVRAESILAPTKPVARARPSIEYDRGEAPNIMKMAKGRP